MSHAGAPATCFLFARELPNRKAGLLTGATEPANIGGFLVVEPVVFLVIDIAVRLV